jgi:hypothetical protein
MAKLPVDPAVKKYMSRVERSPLRFLHWAGLVVLIAAQVYFIFCGVSGLNAEQRATIAASLFTADALLLTAWQWWAQRREAAEEAYFARLDLPNQRRLAFYEQVLALGGNAQAQAEEGASAGAEAEARAGAGAVSRGLEQFYVFFVYAELDNLAYAFAKYANGSMSGPYFVRAVSTFITRCRQSGDFRGMAGGLVRASGYPQPFEEMVGKILVECRGTGDDVAHPMRYDELSSLPAGWRGA